MIKFILHSIFIVAVVWINIGSAGRTSTASFPRQNRCEVFLTAAKKQSVPLTLIQHIRTLFYLDINHTESGFLSLDKPAAKSAASEYGTSRRKENVDLFYQPWYKFLHPVSSAYYIFALHKIII